MGLLSRAIGLALRRPSPNRIPLTGAERLRARDYFSVTLADEHDRNFLVSSSSATGVQGFWVPVPDGVDQPETQEIPWSRASEMTLEIRQYLMELEFGYTSAFGFLVSQLLLLPSIKLNLRRVYSTLFNIRPIKRKEELVILAFLAEKRLAGSNNFFSSIQIASEFHTEFLWGHPDRDRVLNFYALWLESLAEHGDLERQENRYRIHARGLTRLSEEEKDDRRHTDAVRLQVTLALLTFLLVLVGFGQLVVMLIAAILSGK